MAAIGRSGWIPLLVAGAGNLLGGWLADRFSHTPVFFLFGLIPPILWRLMGPLAPLPAPSAAVN